MPTQVSSNGYSIDLHAINDVVSALNGVELHKLGMIPEGFFFRLRDFETSYKRLVRVYYQEFSVALRLLNKGYSAQKLNDSLKSEGVSIDSNTDSGFQSYELGSLLRHFLNDTCRILEPLTQSLASRFPTVSAVSSRGNVDSFNAYISKLERAGVTSGLNDEYFLALYHELWNDYKHASSSGIQATSWSFQDGNITKSMLSGSRLKYFKGMAIDDFMNQTLQELMQLTQILCVVKD